MSGSQVEQQFPMQHQQQTSSFMEECIMYSINIIITFCEKMYLNSMQITSDKKAVHNAKMITEILDL